MCWTEGLFNQIMTLSAYNGRIERGVGKKDWNTLGSLCFSNGEEF